MSSDAERLALLLTGLDPALARFTQVALDSYRRACLDADRPGLLPDADALTTLTAALDRTARSDQFRARLGQDPHPHDMAAAGFLTYAQAVDATGLSEPTIRRRVKAGQLRAHRSGRRVLFDPADLLNHLQGAT